MDVSLDLNYGDKLTNFFCVNAPLKAESRNILAWNKR
jgi:hypothetical protein